MKIPALSRVLLDDFRNENPEDYLWRDHRTAQSPNTYSQRLARAIQFHSRVWKIRVAP